jgi:sulfonate transport system permease protein
VSVSRRVGRGPKRGAHLPGPVRRLLGPLILLAIWWVLTAASVVSPRSLPPPSTVAETAGSLVGSGELLHAVLVSLQRVGLGLAAGVSVGLTLALLSGLFRFAEDLLDTPMQMFRALPALALVPFALLWFGIGELPKVLLIAWATTFPVYINTVAAIRGVDGTYRDLARTLRLTRTAVVRRVVLPGAMPGFLVGLRYSLTLGWLVLVVSEQINAADGIGHLMTDARQLYQTDVMVVCLFVYGFLGWSSDLFVRGLERVLLRWRREFRDP